MRILLQRVLEASVEVGGEVIGRIGPGYVALVGIGQEDGPAELAFMTSKLLNLRIFADEEGKMNRSLLDTGGAVLAVSQFTLYADCRKGRRPNFMGAAAPEVASAMFDDFVAKLREAGVRVETGRFGSMMRVSLVNDGPVTIWLDSAVDGR